MTDLVLDEVKRTLPRSRPQLWSHVERWYAADNPAKWRALAQLALAEALGWSPSWIALAFDTVQCSVEEEIEAEKRQLRARFVPQSVRCAAEQQMLEGSNHAD